MTTAKNLWSNKRRRSFLRRVVATIALTLCLVGLGSHSKADSCPPFKHPGVIVTKEQLDFVKSKLSMDPWKSAYSAVRADPHGSATYTPRPPLAAPATDITPATPDGVVLCGSFSDPDVHCTDEKEDGVAAYTQALLWYLSGDETYAKNALAILNGWSILTDHRFSNAPLQSGWMGTEFVRAAEIMRYTYPAWAQADVDKFANMLKIAFIPRILSALPGFVTQGEAAFGQNGNRVLSFADTLIQIAVFLDDRALFNYAVGIWKDRAPAYCYVSTDGPHPKLPMGGYNGGGYATTATRVVDPYGYYGQAGGGTRTLPDGLSQETCRDLEHVQYGLAAMINAAETARIQGVDLYAQESARIVACLEFNAKFEPTALPLPAAQGTIPVPADVTVSSGDNTLCPDKNGVGTIKLLANGSLGYFAVQPMWRSHTTSTRIASARAFRTRKPS
jgi:hypothetical protein